MYSKLLRRSKELSATFSSSISAMALLYLLIPIFFIKQQSLNKNEKYIPFFEDNRNADYNLDSSIPNGFSWFQKMNIACKADWTQHPFFKMKTRIRKAVTIPMEIWNSGFSKYQLYDTNLAIS